MNKIDKQILQLLQENAQISNLELAEKVSLSPSPCLRRVKQLEEQGFIKKQVAILDTEKLGLQLTIFVSIGLKNHGQALMNEFTQTIKDIPEILECHLIAGNAADYLLKVIVPDLQHFQEFLLKKLTCIQGVSTVHSSFVLQKVINKTSVPLEHL